MPREVIVRSGRDLGLAVAEARAARGLSQQQLADQSGIARTYLARLERGLSVQFVDRTLRLLRRLGATVLVQLPDEAPQPITGDASQPQAPVTPSER